MHAFPTPGSHGILLNFYVGKARGGRIVDALVLCYCPQRLKEMDIEIIETGNQGKDFSGVKSTDVVILPAFGASVSEMQLLNERGVQIVDTTCPWVAKVRHCCNTHTAGLAIFCMEMAVRCMAWVMIVGTMRLPLDKSD